MVNDNGTGFCFNFRENKDFASADLIRERLQKIGIEFKDLPEGTTWEVTDNK